MKRFRLPWSPVPDDEYVDSIRRWMTRWRRVRPLFIILYVILLGAITWIMVRFVPLLLGLVQPAKAPLALLGFTAGVSVGLMCGWLFHEGVQGLISAIGGFRSERMLLKYYDVASSHLPDAPKAEKSDTEFRDLTERCRSW